MRAIVLIAPYAALSLILAGFLTLCAVASTGYLTAPYATAAR